MYQAGSFLLNHTPEGTDLRLDVPPLRRLGSFLVQEHARRAPKSTQQHQDDNREIDKVRCRAFWPSDLSNLFHKARALVNVRSRAVWPSGLSNAFQRARVLHRAHALHSVRSCAFDSSSGGVAGDI